MLTLTYSLLHHGWAQVSLSDGGEPLTLVVSYTPSSALDQLVEAMISLLQGPGEVSFRWYEEPGEYQVVLTRHGDSVEMRVLARRTLGRWPGDQQWAQIFAAEEDVLSLAIQVRSQLRQLRYTHGIDGYRASWRWDFPGEAQRRLVTLIREEKARR